MSDSGETRTLRLIYFLPNDQTFNPDVVDSMKARIPRIRTTWRTVVASGSTGCSLQTDPCLLRSG